MLCDFLSSLQSGTKLEQIFKMAAKENVVVSSVGNTRSVCVQLHPLVIMNISDHYTRIRSQANGGNPQGRIGFFYVNIN